MDRGRIYQKKQREITALKLYDTTTVDEIYRFVYKSSNEFSMEVDSTGEWRIFNSPNHAVVGEFTVLKELRMIFHDADNAEVSRLVGHPGDYIVKLEDGSCHIWGKDSFEEDYEEKKED